MEITYCTLILEVRDRARTHLDHNRRFKKMGHFRLAHLFLNAALHTWSESFFPRDHKYWESEY